MDHMTKSDAVTAAIRELIFTGEVAAGEPLRQRDLAARFGISPTPVREALRRLEAEGLIDYDVHRGATVVEASFGPSEENFQIRSVLEALAARLAAQRIEPAELDELREIHERLCDPDLTELEIGDLNKRFHFVIYEAARSPMLLSLLRLLWQSFPRGPQTLRPAKESSAQHATILTALEAGDPDQAEDLLREHILSATTYLRPAPGADS